MVYILLVLALVFGVYLANVNEELNTSSTCTLLKNECHFSTPKGQFWLKFEQTPVAEEELNIFFGTPEGIKVKNAYIEGVNMYMGKTPVIFEDGLPANTAVTFLGSCNLEEMQWALYVETKVDAKSELFRIDFSTYQ